MKFANEIDEKLVNLECESNGLPMDEFIKRRSKIIHKMLDFRKSQDAKRNWKVNRRSMMKGIIRFNKSTQGKRFHRQLGRWLATRKDNVVSLSRESVSKFEELVLLNSIRTHLAIEANYVMPFDEDVEFRLFYEIVDGVLDSVIRKVKSDEDVSIEELEVISDIYEPTTEVE